MPGAVWAASARAWALDGRVVHLRDPLPPTRDLVIAVQSAYAWRIVLHTMRDDHDRYWLWKNVREGALRPPTIDRIADGVVESLFGQPRWVIQRIWTDALGSWRELDAELLGRGVDAMALPPDRATNAAYGVLRGWRAGDRNKLESWIKGLAVPPPRVMHSPMGEQDAAAAWMAAAQRLNRGAPVTLHTPAGVDSEITIT